MSCLYKSPYMPPSPYRPSRRNWVKLWVNEWLTGTVRFQMSSEQRSLWADLLALAGASRHPGIIAAGETNGVLDAYPLDYLCGILRCEITWLKETLKLFEEQVRIKNDGGVIHIVNWTKYQSEYHQKRGRKSAKRAAVVSQMSDQKSSIVEREVEVEGEVDVDGEKKNTPLASLAGFALFWEAYPKKVGKPAARRAWLSAVMADDRWPEVIAGLDRWKASPGWVETRYIPHPATFLNQKRWEDEVPKDGGKVERPRAATNAEVRRENTDRATRAVFGRSSGLAERLRGSVPTGVERTGAASLPGNVEKSSSESPARGVHAVPHTIEVPASASGDSRSGEAGARGTPAPKTPGT